MRALYYVILLAVAAILLYALLYVSPTAYVQLEHQSVLIVYHPSLLSDNQEILNGYLSVLQEEGVPTETVTATALISRDPEDIAKAHPAIIFPDAAAQIVPGDTQFWALQYLASGGNIAVVLDAATKDFSGGYLDEAVLARVVGLDYCLYDKLHKQTPGKSPEYLPEEKPHEDDETGKVHDRQERMPPQKKKGGGDVLASIRFNDEESAKFFEMPPGKVWNDLFVSGYKTERLQYSILQNAPIENIKPDSIHAWGVVDTKTAYPALTRRHVGGGEAVYIDLPLGHLKVFGSDDLMMRSILRAFLFRIAKIPHLMNTPKGQGGLVVNWHIDDYQEWDNISWFMENGFFRENLPASLHITAGEFVTVPEDREGFDACGRGREAALQALKFGQIGSHGGWRHNWFASNIQNGTFGESEITEYIQKNSECLQSLTNYPIIEYSAPDGVHPQPLATEVLEKLGFVAYYFTGDAGSGPNRTFAEGKMVSDKVFAFPVMPIGVVASIAEMFRSGMPEKDLERGFVGTVDYAADNRVTRLLYSHPYDVHDHPVFNGAFTAFLDRAEALQKEGRLTVKPMNDYARFMGRMIKTESTFKLQEKGLDIALNNSEGLEDITVAIPKSRYRVPENGEWIATEDADYVYLTIKDGTHASIPCSLP